MRQGFKRNKIVLVIVKILFCKGFTWCVGGDRFSLAKPNEGRAILLFARKGIQENYPGFPRLLCESYVAMIKVNSSNNSIVVGVFKRH